MGFTILELLREERNILINIFQERNMKNITGNSVTPVVTDITFDYSKVHFYSTKEEWEESIKRDDSSNWTSDISIQEAKQNLGFPGNKKHYDTVTRVFLGEHEEEYGINVTELDSLYQSTSSQIGKFIEGITGPPELIRKMLSALTPEERKKINFIEIDKSAGHILETEAYYFLADWCYKNGWEMSKQNPMGANNPPDFLIRKKEEGRICRIDAKSVKVSYTSTGKVSNAMNNTACGLPILLKCAEKSKETGKVHGELTTIACILKYAIDSKNHQLKIVDAAYRTYPETIASTDRGERAYCPAIKYVSKESGETQNNNVRMTMNEHFKKENPLERVIRLAENEKLKKADRIIVK